MLPRLVRTDGSPGPVIFFCWHESWKIEICALLIVIMVSRLVFAQTVAGPESLSTFMNIGFMLPQSIP